MSGDSVAQCQLGIDYDMGRGVFENYTAAREWFTRSAAQHDGCGITNFGNLYFDGDGVPQDYTVARSYFEAGALAGYSAAFYNLGIIYQNGDDVQVDERAAIEWLSKAAIAKNVLTYSKLGDLYAFGHQFKIHNVGLAVHYYRLAIEARYPDTFCCAADRRIGAASNLAFLYLNVYKGNDQLRYHLVLELLRRSPKDEWSQYEIAQMYANGLGVKRNYDIAAAWWKKSADQGYAPAAGQYARFLLTDDGKSADSSTGLRYLHQAVAGGDEDAMTDLASLKFDGLYVPRDRKGAVALYTAASARGSMRALNHLANLYLNGEGVSRSLYQAYILFSVEADLGARWGPGLKQRLERGLTQKQLDAAHFEIKRLDREALTAQDEQTDLPAIPASTNTMS
ncbi:MAG TPA: SEL1-like repeat protein [Candidatus Eremiobacteraceae bacterium]